MLWAMHADELRKRMDRRQTQITRGTAAATFLLQIPQKRAHAGWREIIDRKAINWLPQCFAQERKQKDQRIAITELGIAREIALCSDVFQEEPAYPWSNRVIVTHLTPPIARSDQSANWLPAAVLASC